MVVKIQETTLSEDHSDLLKSQHWLANAYEASGQGAAARTYCQNAKSQAQ